MPDGLAVAGLFGGAVVLLGLALVGPDGLRSNQVDPALVAGAAVVAFGTVLAAGILVVDRLRSSG